MSESSVIECIKHLLELLLLQQQIIPHLQQQSLLPLVPSHLQRIDRIIDPLQPTPWLIQLTLITLYSEGIYIGLSK